MSFVTTQPAALTSAALNLEGIGSAMAAQNAAAAAPTTGVAPAAADEVSAMQATQFAAYGELYQHISAQAQAIHEMFVHNLGANAGSYGDAEASNTVASSAAGAGLSGLGGSSAGTGSSFGLGGLASNAGILGAMQAGTVGSAASEFTGLGKGFISEGPGVGFAGPALASEAAPTSAAAPATPAAAAGPAPVLASAGQAAEVGGVSVPPTWAAAPASSSSPVTLTGAGAATATAPHTPMAALPAAGPALASAAGRGGSYGFGVPRYGVRRAVMSRQKVV
jgi:hypothetical protein